MARLDPHSYAQDTQPRTKAFHLTPGLAAGNVDPERLDLDANNRAIENRDSFRTVSIVTLSAGAALLAGGALLYLFDRPGVTVLPPRSVEPSTTPRTVQPIDLTASPMLGPGT